MVCFLDQGMFQEFVSQADQEMTELLRAYAHMKQEYKSVLKFFGEDSSTMRIDDFFSTFAAFISDFEVQKLVMIISFNSSLFGYWCLESSEGKLRSPGEASSSGNEKQRERTGSQEEGKFQVLLQIKQQELGRGYQEGI